MNYLSQFNYCPLVQICHHHSMNNKITCLHDRSLHIISRISGSPFGNLLDTEGNDPVNSKIWSSS